MIYGISSAKTVIQENEINRVMRKAANGNVREQERLASFYRLGWWSIEKNDGKAIEWYRLAGTPSAKDVLCWEFKECQGAD